MSFGERFGKIRSKIPFSCCPGVWIVIIFLLYSIIAPFFADAQTIEAQQAKKPPVAPSSQSETQSKDPDQCANPVPDSQSPAWVPAVAPPVARPAFTSGAGGVRTVFRPDTAPAVRNQPNSGIDRWSQNRFRRYSRSTGIDYGDSRNPIYGYVYGGYARSLGVSYNNSLYYSPIAGVFDGRIDPNLIIYPPQDQNAIPEAPPTAEELIAETRYRDAEDLLRAELADAPGDAVLARLLAVALAGTGDFENASKQMSLAYQVAPTLSTYPFSEQDPSPGVSELRALSINAVRFARRTPSAEAWLLVAVLIQAQGRHDVSARMMDRAAALGLDRAVVNAWPDPSHRVPTATP